MHAFSCYISHKRGMRKQELRYSVYAIKWLKECTSAPRPGNYIRWLIIKRTHRRYDATNLLNLNLFLSQMSRHYAQRKWTLCYVTIPFRCSYLFRRSSFFSLSVFCDIYLDRYIYIDRSTEYDLAVKWKDWSLKKKVRNLNVEIQN